MASKVEVSKAELMYRAQMMGELKSILLAVDGSEYSSGAVKEALLFARHCNVKLTLLYVLGLSDGFETGGLTFVEQMDPTHTEYFDGIREEAADSNVELDIIIRRTSEAYVGIIDEAMEKQSDVIVMGRRGITGLKRVLMGSVTAKVIAYAPCKVLVVPKDTEIKGEIILFATDGSESSVAAEREAINMASRCPFVKQLLVTSVAAHQDKLKEANDILDKVRKNAESRGVKIEALPLVGDPYKAIVNLSMESGADIIVMGTHGRTGLERLLMGSVAERVTALAMCSSLVVKN
ncbi:MAG: universal stress protein [Nitrospirae bacterium]|nr:universal stress protein [Nitrospirota bacterium]